MRRFFLHTNNIIFSQSPWNLNACMTKQTFKCLLEIHKEHLYDHRRRRVIASPRSPGLVVPGRLSSRRHPCWHIVLLLPSKDMTWWRGKGGAFPSDNHYKDIGTDTTWCQVLEIWCQVLVLQTFVKSWGFGVYSWGPVSSPSDMGSSAILLRPGSKALPGIVSV